MVSMSEANATKKKTREKIKLHAQRAAVRSSSPKPEYDKQRYDRPYRGIGDVPISCSSRAAGKPRPTVDRSDAVECGKAIHGMRSAEGELIRDCDA